MELKREIKFYAINNITQATSKDSLYAVKGSGENSFKLYVTDSYNNLIPLYSSSGGGTGGGITDITSTDGSVLITGSDIKNIRVSAALQTLINSALQSGDFVSTLVNDAGYITLADLPIFDPLAYDLEDFTNISADPFVRQSEAVSGTTNLAYTASPTNGIVTSDTGSDATIPLATITNAGLLSSVEKSKIATAIQPSDLGAVATSNDYTDLDNIPTTFTPSSHTHVEADIIDLDKYTQLEVDNFLDDKVDKVAGKGLSTEDYTTTEKSKLAGIEAGAEVNNISDVNATDLTDGGETNLHNHDSRYYTESEIDAFLADINTDVLYKDTVKLSENITKGQAVYVSGANGTNILVSKASNATEATSSKTLGLLETTGVTNDIVKVVTSGLLDGLDTSTATIGDPVWLGISGNLIYGLVNKPVAPAHLVYIGVVTRVHAVNGEILVKVQNGFELNEIHDVLLASLVNNDVLQYESASGLWKNKQIVEDAIVNGVTDKAPSQNSVFDALALKQNTLNPLDFSDFWQEHQFNTLTPPMMGGTAISSGTNNTAIPTANVSPRYPYGAFLRSSTTANGGYRYQVANTGYDFFGTIGHKFQCVFYYMTSFTGRTIRLGYLDTSTSSDSSDGAYFEILGNAINCKTASSAVRTTTPMTATLSLAINYAFDIEVNSSGTLATFRLYNADTATLIETQTISTNIPTTNTRTFGASFIATEVSVTASDIGIIRYIGFGTIGGFNKRR